MGRNYAQARRSSPVLEFRLRSRALLAAEVYCGRRGRPQDARVLDLGAAEGATLLQLRELLGPAGQFDGVELSAELLGEAGRLPDNVRLIAGDVTRLPRELEDQSYDLVTALAVLEHLEDPLRCLREAYRVLVPGGVVVATSPSPIWDELAGRLGLVEAEHHAQKLGAEQLLSWARRAGFERVGFEPFMWAPIGALPYLRLPIPPGRARRLDRSLARWRLLRSTFVNQCIVGSRPE